MPPTASLDWPMSVRNMALEMKITEILPVIREVNLWMQWKQ
jgi:hypothetical protein